MIITKRDLIISMKNFMDFTGKKYIVTGASSGMGRATAIVLAQLGATVVLASRNKEKLLETLSMMPGENHIVFPVDLGAEDDLTPLFEASISDGGKLDGFVHCAGVATILPINMIRRKQMNDCMSVNLFSFLEMTRLFSKRKYHNESGSIVVVSSIVVKRPAKCQTIYAASKGAINAAVQALAFELAEKNIRINCIMPASTDTAMMREAFKSPYKETEEDINKHQILGLTKPEEIANYITFLLSDASSVVTGREFYADGGLL